MNRTEADQIATAITYLRPDWFKSSLVTIMCRHQHRSARDVAMALVWIAYDPETKTPGRIDAEGPWWAASRTAGVEPASPPAPRCDTHGDYLPCLHCQRDAAGEPASADRVRDILDAAGIRRSGGRPAPLTEPHQGPITSEPHHRPTEAETEAERARQLAALETITEGATDA